MNNDDDGRLIKIPVVFHVLYGDKLPDNGRDEHAVYAGNSTMYLPQEKIESERADLDADFQCLNADLSEVSDKFKNVIGNPRIHFYLSNLKYVEVNKKEIQRPSTNLDLLHELSPIVDSKRNLNVYISIIKYEGSFSEGVTPVKTPGNTHDEYDVVNVNYQWVGLRYRLLTHEVGHWLGLWHTWDDAQLADGIDDIPLQKTYTDMPCVYCPPEDVPDQVRRNSGFNESNYNNFMDYSGCRKMFSIKQAQHMRQFIRTYRPEIWGDAQ
ncbi:MAG TPA: M43 family zinc metalloprotease [Pyrinomonadaceae bacterium]|nr:M43 family zinc metalloprotease [Pyrinomonadaceae bacterium]